MPLPFGDIPAALEGGEIDCGNIFSTDPAIDTGGFVALEDDLAIVPNEAVLPLVRSELVTPELTAALDEVNAALDTETLTAVDGPGRRRSTRRRRRRRRVPGVARRIARTDPVAGTSDKGRPATGRVPARTADDMRRQR